MSRKPSLLASAIKTAEPPATVRPSPGGFRYAGRTQTPCSQRAINWELCLHRRGPTRRPKRTTCRLPIGKRWKSSASGRAIRRDKRIPQERLVAEALNLLFAKYNFPVVREGGNRMKTYFHASILAQRKKQVAHYSLSGIK